MMKKTKKITEKKTKKEVWNPFGELEMSVIRACVEHEWTLGFFHDKITVMNPINTITISFEKINFKKIKSKYYPCKTQLDSQHINEVVSCLKELMEENGWSLVINPFLDDAPILLEIGKLDDPSLFVLVSPRIKQKKKKED